MFIGVLVLCLLGISTSMCETVNRPKVDLRPALTGYVYWMERVSRIFERQAVETMNMEAIEEEGEEVHKILIGAIADEEINLNITLNKKQLSKALMKSLEADMKELRTDTVIGLLLADSVFSSLGARMTVASRLFAKITEKMKKKSQELEHNKKFLKAVYKHMSAAEIALDTMIKTFKLVEEISMVHQHQSHHRSKRGICTGLPSGPRIGSYDLGGGFSTDGSSVVFNRGRTTVTATPHFNILPKPKITGGNVAFEHRFDRIPGSISGHITVDGQGKVQNAGIQLKIDL